MQATDPATAGLSPCPSCGKPIEPVQVCYYCCAAIEPWRRITEKRLVQWTLGVALLGVALLVWAAFTATPVTPVSELATDGAFLHYRIQGEVVRSSVVKTPYADADIYNFWIDDRSATKADDSMIKLKIEGPVYADLKEAGKVPAKGDRIDVEGTLYAGEGFRLLSLNTAAMLHILNKEGE
jgi:predicted nucleic acid-binding Zn ribbon protein